jgi:hypothetical protein
MLFKRSHLFIFFALSICTAYVVHKWNKHTEIGFAEFASSTPQDLSEQIQKILAAGGDVKSGLRSLGAKGAEEVYNCQCAVAGIESPNFQFEEAKACDPARNYFEQGLQKIPPIYREERAKSSNEFPRVCMTYIMRNFFSGAQVTPSQSFAACTTANSQPQPGVLKPCVTAQYVTTIYNYFGDISDCFAMPQRDFLPKLYNESGLHINTLGAGFDAGISQFVGVTIADSNEYFEKYKKEAMTSKKDSCQRLAPYLKSMKASTAEKAHRCQLMSVPENPLKNLFYLAIKYKRDVGSIKDFMNRPEFNIISRMEKLGLKKVDIDDEQMQQMLITLGFNAGAKSAVKMLSKYLEAVEISGRQLQLSDFNFSKEVMIYNKVDRETGVLLKPVRKENESDQDYEIRWQKKLKKFTETGAQLTASDVRYKAQIEPYTQVDPITNESYATFKMSWEPGQLSFPAYLMAYQDSGSAGYLSSVRRAANELNTVFKEGVCVPDSYLQL